MKPLTAEIKYNNLILSNSVIRVKKIISRGNIAKEHAGSDKRFENETLCFDQLPLKIQKCSLFLCELNTNSGSESRSEHATSM